MNKINIQLYSVKDALSKDFQGTMKKLADIGYDGVEFCGNYGGMDGDELKSFLDYIGLEAVSAHISVDELEIDEKFNYHTEILAKCGCMYIMQPWAKPENGEEAKKYGERLEKMAEKLAVAGFNFGFHTHGYEFETKDKDGVTIFDNIMAPAELLLAEFDTYWLKKGGADIGEYIRRYTGRINLMHLKQMDATPEGGITSLDRGIIDYAPIIKDAEKFGTEHFIIEQDHPTVDELTDAENSYNFIKQYMK